MVSQTDPTGGASAMTTSYQYVGGAAWHYDDNELVKAKYRTYGQFRGYGDVITYLGDGVTDRQSKTETTYYRGMSKDNNSTAIAVTDSQGGSHEDLDQLAGDTLESSAYLGANVDHSTITSYWVSDAVASRSRTGLPALTSNWVAPVETFTRQAVTSTGSTTWRNTETDTGYDATTTDANFGLQEHIYAHTVPVDPAYSSCTSTTYAAPNATKNLVGLVAQTETDSVACGGYTAGSTPSAPGGVNTLTAPTSVSRPDQVKSATRTFYDDTTFSTTFPQASVAAYGEATMSQVADGYASGAFTWHTASRAKYDSRGRQTDAYDGNGNDTVTAYTDNSAGLLTGVTVTNAVNQAVSKTLDTQRGLTLTSTDANSVVTTEQYDALGRVTGVWLVSRPISSAANYLFAYSVLNNGPTAVTTQTLNDGLGYRLQTLIYDGLFRPRQTQVDTPVGGRLITDTFYDTRGWVKAKYTNWDDSGSTPTTSVASAANLGRSVPQEDVYTYNSLGQAVIDQNENSGVEVSRSTTVDNGDRTTVIPPVGGTVTTTVTDPLGRTSEIDNYVGRPVLNSPADPFTGVFTVTGGASRPVTYGYDGHGNQSSTTQGTGGPTWSTTFNLLGQAVAKTDPDAGASTGLKYDGAGNLVEATDALAKTTSFTYDALNRKTAAFDSTVAGQQAGAGGNQLGAWVYDNTNSVSGVTHAAGQLTTETTYLNGAAYTTQQTNFNIFGESLGATVTIPSTEGALAGSYTVSHTYTTNAGLLLKDTYKAFGGLPAETVVHSYRSPLDLPDSIGGGYTQTTSYDAYSRVSQIKVGPSTTVFSTVDYAYDPNNGHLTHRFVDHTGGGVTSTLDDQKYAYDLAGNIISQTGTRNGSADSSETQCYGYDGLDQLVSAWTANDLCATAPTSANSSTVADKLGAGSAYWTTWSIDGLGDRSGKVQHAFGGGPATDTTTTYSYGANGGQPHTLTSTSTTGGSTGSTSYGYDVAGNMKVRNAGQGNQALGYDDSGNLTSVTGSTGGNTGYEYDADGNLLVQKDPGATTLYVGNQQFTLNSATGVVTGVRYYTLPDGSQVVRTGTSTAFTFAIADQHGTPSLYLDSTATTPTWRQYTPYGEPRGATVTPPDNRGFLDKPADAVTGLTVLGARDYDPVIGRFTSVDPVLEQDDPTQLNGYGYAGNDPVNGADPTGQSRLKDGDSGTSCWDACQKTIGAIYNANKGGSGSGKTSTTKKKKRSALTRYATQLVEDTSHLLASATPGGCLMGGSGGIEAGVQACISQGNPLPLLNRARDVAGCQFLFLGCRHLFDEYLGDLDCQDGITAECSANVTFTAATLLGTAGEGEAGLADDAAGTKAGAEPTGCSFAATTPVLMADHSTKPIDHVKVGDEVTATDPADGKLVSKTVTALHDDLDTDMADVTIANGLGAKTVIHTTQNHPFWDTTTNKWTRADHLHPGDHLKSTTTALVYVASVHTFTQPNYRFNLTVTDLHTYYVLAGNTPVLVHNTGPCDIPNGSSGGPGAGQRIPPSMLRDYNIGVNADPNLPTPVCSYCRANPATSVDHVHPRSQGGDLTPENTTPACTFCNSSKGARTAPVNPPPNYVGPWPPPWWPPSMQ